MAGLEIRLLGGFELAREGQTLEQLPLRAARSLFAYLVLNRERPHTRDLLAGTFWPEFDASPAPRGRRFLHALEALPDPFLPHGDLEGALVPSRRLAAENEFDEEAHRRVMRI